MKKKEIFFGISAALILAIFSFMADVSPDGLERVAEDFNLIDKAASWLTAPFKDYLVPGIKNKIMATLLAGVAGVSVVFLLGVGLARLLRINK
jgi:hypothetical protein